MKICKWIVCLSVLSAVALPAMGAVILPEDDATWRGGTRNNNTSVFGLFTRSNGTSDRAYVEFPLDTTTATSAELKLYNYWGTPQGKVVNYDISIRAISENDAGYVQWTDTAGPAPSGTAHETWPQVATFHVDSTPAWYAFDITSLYNANLGKRVTFSVRAISGSGDGPIFEDKENTGLSGNAPQIVWVPEPTSLLVMLLGLAAVKRRR